ncbi:MAG: RDD family protein [Gammaproteobacteria bacterium]
MTSKSNAAVMPGSNPSARLLRRLAALLYDGFLVVAIWFVIGYFMQLLFGPDANQLVDGQVQTDPVMGTILFALMVASAFGFYAWFWMKSGQTLGMIAWRLRLETPAGQLVGLDRAALRWLLAWPSFALFGVGFFWLYIDPNGDTMHDRFSRTRVVLLPKSHQPFK